MNIRRRVEMQRAVDTGASADSLDPTSARFTGSDLTAPELTFYTRVDGWTEHKNSTVRESIPTTTAPPFTTGTGRGSLYLKEQGRT
jgi:hypothetical protein